MAGTTLTEEQIGRAVADLDRLCRDEYGDSYGLEDLLDDPDTALASQRLQRLSGILLKRPFGQPVPLTGSSETGSKRAWQWNTERFGDPEAQATGEFEMLDALRRSLWPDATFEQLAGHADHERGLYKILSLWIGDTLKRRGSRSLAEYFNADESPRMEAALDWATTLTQAGLGPVLAPLIPVPGVVVSVLLIGARFGYRSLTQAPEVPDQAG
jgi:hypothetical protein